MPILQKMAKIECLSLFTVLAIEKKFEIEGVKVEISHSFLDLELLFQFSIWERQNESFALPLVPILQKRLRLSVCLSSLLAIETKSNFKK